MIHIVALLTNSLDDGILKEFLVLACNILVKNEGRNGGYEKMSLGRLYCGVQLHDFAYLDIAKFGIDKESGRVALGVFSGLNGSTFAVGIVVGSHNDPVERIGEGHQERKAICTLSIDINQRSQPVYLWDRRKTVAVETVTRVLETKREMS